NLKHGVFCFYVLQGLRGKAKDEEGKVTWDGLALYVRRQVSRAVPRLIKGASQQPNELKESKGEPPVILDGLPDGFQAGERIQLPRDTKAERATPPQEVSRHLKGVTANGGEAVRRR